MDITSYLLGKNSGGGGGGGSLDWAALGYNSTPQAIIDGYNYAKQIQENWVPATSLSSKFSNDEKLKYMPLVDTTIATNMYQTFYACHCLQAVPVLDTSNVQNMRETFSYCTELTTMPILNLKSCTTSYSLYNMFYGTTNFSDEALDNILQMCPTATLYEGSKTLTRLGILSTNYPATRIQALPHYQAFIDAGWTIGY